MSPSISGDKEIRWVQRDGDYFAYRGEIALAYITKTNGHYRTQILSLYTINDKDYQQWHDELSDAMKKVEELFGKDDD